MNEIIKNAVEEKKQSMESEAAEVDMNSSIVIPMARFEQLIIAEYELGDALENLEEAQLEAAATAGYLEQVKAKLDLAMKENVELRRTLREYEDKDRMEMMGRRDRGVIIHF